MNFSRGVVCWIGLFAGLVSVLGAAVPSAKTPAADRVVVAETFDRELLAGEIFRATNDVRIREGLPPFKLEPQLVVAANEQAAMQAIRIHSGHDNPLPNQGDPSARAAQAGLPAGMVAENAATLNLRNPEAGGDYTYRKLAAVFVKAWMDSPGHRANLLNPSLRFLGCGTRVALLLRGQPVVYAIQNFYTPAPPPPEPPPPSIRPGATSITH